MRYTPASYTSRQRLITAPTVTRDLTVRSTYPHGRDMALAYISLYPYGIAYQDIEPTDSDDGSPAAATMHGDWGRLYKAGRRL